MEKTWLKSYATGVPEEVDFKNITLSEGLSQTATKFPGNPALIFQGVTISFRDMDLMVSRFASALKSLGVRPGERVGILLPNLVQTAVAIYAAFRVGAIAAPNNPLYTDRELEYQFNDSGCKLLICWDILVPRMLKLREKTAIRDIVSCHIRDYLPFPFKQLFPLLKRDLHLKTPREKGMYEFVELLKSHEPISRPHDAHMDDTAVLIYTGGTTGVAKGVELTHRNLSSNCQQMRAWCPEFQEGKETVLGCLPLFHSYGVTVVLNMAVLHGWGVVLIPKPETKAILDAVDKYKVTLIPGVPTLFNAIINHPDVKRYSLKSIKTCFSAAAPLPMETIRGFKELTGTLICEAYGLTETSPCTHAIPLGGKEKPGCIGLPIPSTDAKLVDADDAGREITAVGQAGELCVKGPQVMKGYINRSEDTAAALRDGWMLTGDIAVVDDDGYFTIVDRKKDMIISGGFNIYPREVDEVLFTHPKVKEACAIGVPDRHSGERVKAFVVLKDGQAATEPEIVEFCKERLTRYKVPKYVEFVDELPKSAIGKILRKELKQMDQGLKA